MSDTLSRALAHSDGGRSSLVERARRAPASNGLPGLLAPPRRGNTLEQTLGVGQTARGRQFSNHAEQLRHNTDWTFACCNCIAQRCAQQPLRVARMLRRRADPALQPQKEFLPGNLKTFSPRMEVLDDHEVLRMLQDPNQLMTEWALTYSTVYSLKLTGKGYWWFYPEQDRSYSVMPLPVSWVEPRHEGRLYSSYTFKPGGQGKGIEIPGEQVVYFYYPDPADPLGALSPLQAAARSVVTDENISEAQRKSFANGIWAGYAVRLGRNLDAQGHPSGPRPDLTSAQRAQIIGTVLQAYRGVMNQDQPIILDNLIEDIQKISLTPREMDFLRSHGMTKERITQIFGVNPVVMGQVEGVNRASAVAAESLFLAGPVNPTLEMISQVLTARVGSGYSRPGERLVLYYEPARPYDEEMELRRLNLLMKYGGMPLNEMRATANLPPLAGGNIAVFPSTFVPYRIEDGEVPAVPAGAVGGPPQPNPSGGANPAGAG
jgi:HK97 family phage portal protein